jgi:hypothetical protein
MAPSYLKQAGPTQLDPSAIRGVRLRYAPALSNAVHRASLTETSRYFLLSTLQSSTSLFPFTSALFSVCDVCCTQYDSPLRLLRAQKCLVNVPSPIFPALTDHIPPANESSKNEQIALQIFRQATTAPSMPKTGLSLTSPLRNSFKMSTSKSSSQLTFSERTARLLSRPTKRPIALRRS